MRKANISRITTETQISCELNLDKTSSKIETPLGFLNHMLELFAKHGQFGLNIKAKGDVQVDDHHLVEDLGIVLGQAFKQAIGDKKGINRYGFFILPMDECLSTVAVDLAGRSSLIFDSTFTRETLHDVATESFYEFFKALSDNARMSLIIKSEYGRNDHHKIEGIFKCLARALKMACTQDVNSNELPTTKGIL